MTTTHPSNSLLTNGFVAEVLTVDEQRAIGRKMILARRRAESAKTTRARAEARAEHDRERDRLAKIMIPWVVREANRRFGRTCYSVEDVIGEAMLAVVEGLRLYDPDKGAATTYLAKWAAKGMGDWVRRRHATIRIPSAVQTLEKAVLDGRRSKSSLSAKERDWLEKASLARRTTSGDAARCGHDGDPTAFDAIEAPADEEPAFDAEDVAKLRATLEILPNRTREVVSRRFAVAGATRRETLAEIAERIGLTKERVRQIERDGLAEMRAALEANV